MPHAKISHTAIRGIHTSVGPILKRIDDDAASFSGNEQQLERIKRVIGLNERRVVDEKTTAADLCEDAARGVLAGLGADAGALDAIICVTQTPDHFQPCNAALLHGRLELPKTVAAFDVNLGCSGYVYGLYLASLMISAGGCGKVLLMAGDTVSRQVHPGDRAVAPLFGDAGSATLLERDEAASPLFFALHTNGQGAPNIIVPAGALREPRSLDTAIETTDEDGNVRTRENLCMNGAEVFNFSIKEEPKAIRELLEFAAISLDDVDAVVFHQANKYIIDNIARRLKLPPTKTPSATVEKYGNQSGASIPGAICHELAERARAERLKLVLSGFGVGLSWASAFLEAGPLAHVMLSVYGD